MNDLVNQKVLLPKEALDALTSYAVAEEGTNTLYLGLVETLCRRDTTEEPYTLTEVEMLLNYFPHAVWQETASQVHNETVQSMRERFYFPVLQALAAGWTQLDNR